MNFTRQDFCNFLVSNFPWKWKDGSLDVETDTPLFVENTFIANWARREGVRVPDAMAALLDINVWPERFRQNCDVYSKEQMQRLLPDDARQQRDEQAYEGSAGGRQGAMGHEVVCFEVLDKKTGRGAGGQNLRVM